MKNMVSFLLLVLLCTVARSFSMKNDNVKKLEKAGINLTLVKVKKVEKEKNPDTKEVIQVAQEVFGDTVPIVFTNILDKKNNGTEGAYKVKLLKEKMIITELYRNIPVLKMIFEGIKEVGPTVPIVFEFISR